MSSIVLSTSTWLDGCRLVAGRVIVRTLVAGSDFSLRLLMITMVSEVQSVVEEGS